MKRRDYRSELKALTTDQLKARIEKLHARLAHELVFNYDSPDSTPVHKKLTYAQTLLERRLAEDDDE